jgi:hypothetical protein
MADLTSEINQMMGQSCYAIPDDVDEADLMDELDALEGELAAEPAMGSAPSYMQVRWGFTGTGGIASCSVHGVALEGELAAEPAMGNAPSYKQLRGTGSEGSRVLLAIVPLLTTVNMGSTPSYMQVCVRFTTWIEREGFEAERLRVVLALAQSHLAL